MEAVNQSSKLIAQSIEIIKGYLKAVDEHEVWETTELKDSVLLLEQALEALITKV